MPVLRQTAVLTWYSAGPSLGVHISYELKGLGSEGRSFRPEPTHHDPVGCQPCGHIGAPCSQQVNGLMLRHVAKCPDT